MRRTHIAMLAAACAMLLGRGASAQPSSATVVRGPAVARAVRHEADVHQLANRVRKVIKLVEENPTIPCETRNHLVRRLRSVDDALESGHRSEAAALVMAWTSEARSHQRAGLLSAPHGAILHNGLQGFVEQIGTGWPEKPGPTRKWPPLPACESGETSGVAAGLTATADASSYTPFDSNDVLVVVRTLVGMVPAAGPLLSGMVAVLWPAGDTDVSALIQGKIDQAMIDDVIVPTLVGLRDGAAGVFPRVRDAWLKDCRDKGEDSDVCRQGAETVYGAWESLWETFSESRATFQTAKTDYQLTLLPLFAQYQTLYLSVLREGILLAPAWVASGKVGENMAAIPAQVMAEELDPNFVNPLTHQQDRGLAYVNAVYLRGLGAQPQATDWDTWKKRNKYERDMTIGVLDFRDTWKFFDPAAYPDGVGEGIKLPRMIYTDPIGHMTDDAFDKGWFQPPSNVAGPLRELTVWAQRAPGDGYLENGSGWAISAVQSTSPPTVGPARSGAITGDATHDGTTGVWYRDLRALGPITGVYAYADRRNALYRWIPVGVTFGFATGTWDHIAGSAYGDNPSFLVNYPGHVLAAVGAMGRYDLSNGYTTDAVIFGFRLFDSFFPSGALVNVKSGKCMDVRYLTAGTRPTIYSCSPGGSPGQIWTYDTNTKVLTIGGEQGLCLEATGTINGSAVQLAACSAAKNQQWELAASADGLSGVIKSVESGLALDVSGGNTADRTPITLWYPHGDTNQQWTVTSPLKGEVHGIGSGRCLDVRSGDTANGTPVQIYDCNGTAAQSWTYNETAHTLSVYNGTKCLDTPSPSAGTALRIWDCSGAGTQAWAFNRDGTLGFASDTGIVLDVQSGATSSGSSVVLGSRQANRPSQRWSRTSRRGGSVHATNAGKCLSLPMDDTQPQIADCLASPAPRQEWTYHPLTQRLTLHFDGTEKCLSSQSSSEGAPAIVEACAANPNQLWTLKDSGVGGTMINAASGLCLTLPGTETVTASGTKVQLNACAPWPPGNPNQQWIW